MSLSPVIFSPLCLPFPFTWISLFFGPLVNQLPRVRRIVVGPPPKSTGHPRGAPEKHRSSAAMLDDCALGRLTPTKKVLAGILIKFTVGSSLLISSFFLLSALPLRFVAPNLLDTRAVFTLVFGVCSRCQFLVSPDVALCFDCFRVSLPLLGFKYCGFVDKINSMSIRVGT